MKKYFAFLFLCIMLNSEQGQGQITLEHTLDSMWFGNKFYCTDIGNNDFKYVILDANTNKFSLYNMDMSPYMTNVSIPVTADSIKNGFTVIYITKSLFDCDSTTIEYVYETQYDVNHKFRVLRTDGTILLEVDSANGPYSFGGYGGSTIIMPIKKTSSGTKLFLQKYDSNNVPQVLVYALCGTLPEGMYDFSQNTFFVKIFPNPAAFELQFDITLPNNQEKFQLAIFDLNSKEITRKSLYAKNCSFVLDVNEYSAGMYTYSLVAERKIYQSGKFIIHK